MENTPNFNSAANVNTMSPGEFAQSHGYQLDDFGMSDNFFANLGDFFGSGRSEVRNKYDNYLLANEREYELAKLNDARNFDLYRDSHKYQMAASDLKAAGLNPWLAVQNGLTGGSSSNSAGSSSSSSSSSATSNTFGHKSQKSFLENVITSAMKVAAIVALKG